MTHTSWSEGEITWNNRPPIDGIQLGYGTVGPDVWTSFDVSAAVVSNGPVSFGFIRGTNDSQRSIDSGDSTNQPVLNVQYEAPSPAAYYVAWVDGYDVDAPGYYADPDNDNVPNFAEYGLGGAPDAVDAAAIMPTFENMHYVYRRRTDAATRGLTYTLEECTNLISNDWNTVTDPPSGIAPLETGFEAVTNQIPTTETNLFIRLRISID